jgi:quinol monooxygenase YgiN
MVVRLAGRLILAPADLAPVEALLPEHVRLTRAEPGCLSFEVTQSASDPLIYEVAESFVDRAAFEAHQVRTRASAWFAATRDIERDFRIDD